MAFNNYIGHKNIVHNINRAIEENKFSHAHLIVGEEGIGKSILAKGIALKILGIDTDREHVDILKWRIAENKKSIGVNEIRELIKEVNKKPFEGDKKVIIVYSGNKLTPQAQNAFLKTIEEPPAGVFILVLTDNIDSILDTIKSRCQIHSLRKLSNEDVKRVLMKKEDMVSDETIDIAVTFSEGVPGKAEIFLNDEKFKEMREFTMEFLGAQRGRDAMKYSANLLEFKDRWTELHGALVNLIRDMVIIKECSDKNMILNLDYVERIEEISQNYSYKALIKMLNSINKANEKIIKNLNFNVAVEVMLLELQEV